MFKKILLLAALIGLAGCVTSENQVKEVIKKNPKIIFDVIEENPEAFIEVVNRAAQKAQRSKYEKQVSEMRESQAQDLKNPKKPKLEDSRRLAGASDAPIIIVEYADFQCPACRMAYESLNKFKEKYKGKVQFYYKHMPLDFHEMAMPAAQYLEAIKLQDKTKAVKFFDYVFQNQKELRNEEFLIKAAKHAGAEINQLKKDLQSDAVAKIIQEDMAEFHSFGFNGTPVILVNGVALHGAQRVEEIERIVKLTVK